MKNDRDRDEKRPSDQSIDRPNYDYTSGGRARDWNRRGDDWGGQTNKKEKNNAPTRMVQR